MKKIKRAWLPKGGRIRILLNPQEKEEIRKQCDGFINSYLKPKIFKEFSSYKNERTMGDIYCKWYKEYFYFVAVVEDNRPDVIFSKHNNNIARLEPKTNRLFYLSYFRHTEEWFDITLGQGFSLKDCLQSILELPHFFPM